MMNRFTRAAVAVLAFTLLAACGGGGNSDTARIDALEQRVARLEATPQETTPTTSSIATTTTSAAATEITTTSRVSSEYVRERNAEMAKLTQKECEQFDTYAFLGFTAPSDPRVRFDGSQFVYDCQIRRFGWYFPGSPEDSWPYQSRENEQVVRASRQVDEHGIPYIDQPIEQVFGDQMTSRHPGHADALTLAELKPGMELCTHVFSLSSDDVNFSLTYHLVPHLVEGASVGAFTRISGNASAFNDPTVILSANPTGTRGEASGLNHLGVTAQPNGNWERDYVTAGACPK